MSDERKYAKDVADWCERSLTNASATGTMDTRAFVQNAELIITALREYANEQSTSVVQWPDEATAAMKEAIYRLDLGNNRLSEDDVIDIYDTLRKCADGQSPKD